MLHVIVYFKKYVYKLRTNYILTCRVEFTGNIVCIKYIITILIQHTLLRVFKSQSLAQK